MKDKKKFIKPKIKKELIKLSVFSQDFSFGSPFPEDSLLLSVSSTCCSGC